MKTIVHIGYGGGVTTMMRDLSTELPGVTFTTLTFGPTTVPTAASNTNFTWQGQFRLDQYLVNIRRLSAWLRETQPELVVLHGFIPMALLGLPARWAQVRKVVGIDVGPQPTFWLIKKIIFWFSRHAISEVMSVCEESAGWFRRYYPWFRHRVGVIDNGVDVPEHVPTRIRLQKPPYVISTLSRIEAPQKDPLTFFRAGLLLHQRNLPVELRFVGDGNLLPTLKKNIVSAGAQEYIHCYGHRSDYQTILEETDIFVLSTNWEGLALSLLAAMSYGLPVVATGVIGNTGVISEGRTGRLFRAKDHVQLADILSELIDNPTVARQLGQQAALEVRQKYTRTKMIAEYQQWFVRLLA